MDNLKRPARINVEAIFNQFVIESGGKLVSSLVSKDHNSSNADYTFDEPQVVAELKCFQKDLFTNEEDAERLVKLLERWKSKKIISDGANFNSIMESKKLPKECVIDVKNAVLKTIDRVIHKANKQIKETKKYLGITEAKGLLFLVNDGNYFLQNYVFIAMICELMLRKYLKSEIDAFVYLTVNQASRIPKSEVNQHVWVPGYRLEGDIKLNEFVNNLGSKFIDDFLTRVAGINLIEHIKSQNIEDTGIREMKYLSKKYL